MKAAVHKLRSRCGESFAEILVAILVVAFGCMLIATMYTAAMNMNLDAAEKDKAYYGAVADMEKMNADDAKETVKVTITDDNGGTLDVYADEYGDEYSAYRKK